MNRLLLLILLPFIYYSHEAVAQSTPEEHVYHAKELLEYGAYSDALAHLMAAAHDNYSKAQYNVAIMYRKGMGGSPSDDRALYWLKRAADNHHERAAATHAKLLQHLTKDALQNKNAIAQTTLGLYHVHLHGIPHNEEAQKWFAMATAQEDAPSEAHRYMAIYCFLEHGDRDAQLEHLRIAAEKGDAIAMETYVLVSCYTATPLNEQKQFEWLLKAAQQNNYSAMRRVAQCYSEGLCGVVKNEQEADKWMQKAIAGWKQNADMWDENAILQLVIHLMQNKNKKVACMYAQRLLHVAPEHSESLLTLASWGHLLPDDLHYAIVSKAAKSGFGPALAILAGCYEQGRGVPKSHKKAAEYYTKALSSPDMDLYPDWREEIKNKLKKIQEESH